MSAVGQITLQQDLQNELTTANQLLRLISIELQQIKNFTNTGGEFEAIIKENASLLTTIANIQHLNIENLPPMERKQIDMSHQTNPNMSYEQHDSFRNASDIDETQ